MVVSSALSILPPWQHLLLGILGGASLTAGRVVTKKIGADDPIRVVPTFLFPSIIG